jgi:DNA polymerase-3 subunit gamma/tau
MVGQSHVLRALTNALDKHRLHHAYLFTGTRGVGKTTVARILAKCLNCETGVAAQPCGACPSCVEIDEGRFVDLIEVDAASRTKVDETRELLDNVQYAPTRGRFKVYLIDEVHMFSNHSFNALLKTLEEPPPHVKFLLATTDPKKLPVTVLSRCLQFNLKRLTADQIESHLEHVLHHEAIPSDGESHRLIAMAADGSLRDALSLLDQAIAYGGGSLRAAEVAALLGTIDKDHVLTLVELLAAKDARGVLAQVQHIAELSPDYATVLGELASQLQRIAVEQMIPEANGETVGSHYRVTELARLLTPEECQLFYQIALMGQRDLEVALDARSGFEMILLRMLAFHRQTACDDAIRMGRGQMTVSSAKPTPEPAAGSISSAGRPWQDLIDELKLSGLVKELASNCVLKRHTADELHLLVSPQYPRNKSIEQRLEHVLRSRFGAELRLKITAGELNEEPPSAMKARETASYRKAAQRAIESDPNVKRLCETFDAKVDTASIRPLHTLLKGNSS